jgi:hypothetical protein
MHPFYVPRSDPDKIDVNVRCLDGVDVDSLKLASFDGKNWEQAVKALSHGGEVRGGPTGPWSGRSSSLPSVGRLTAAERLYC